MKTINKYIVEKLKISKVKQVEHTLFPENKKELLEMIENEIEQNGYECSLNHIDTSNIDDLSYLFSCKVTNLGTGKVSGYGFLDFNGDISDWDVSNVETMHGMFYGSKFTGENSDISQWDVLNVIDMTDMFSKCDFNGDISDWDVSNVKDMCGMFMGSKFNSDISQWDVSNVKDMSFMFYNNTVFNQDISKWIINKDCDINNMFYYTCPIKNEYKPDMSKVK